MFLLPNNIAQKTFVLETCPEKKTNFSSLAREEEGFVFCHFSVLQKTKHRLYYVGVHFSLLRQVTIFFS